MHSLGTPRIKLKTYSHLYGQGRMPTEYDIVTKDLLYYVRKGLEVDTPFGAWLEKNQTQARLRCEDWDAFADPRQTTYTKYVKLQKNQEEFVDQILERMEQASYLDALSEGWISDMEEILPPLRFAFHGLQMISAYWAHLAPSGRIVIAGLLQSADEVRRIQRIAYHTRLLQKRVPTHGTKSKQDWLQQVRWQGLRRFLEELLVTYDWSESFYVLNFLLKPAVDELFTTQLGRLAASRGDYLLNEMLLSLAEDGKWSREWSAALMNLIKNHEGNAAVLEEWKEKWRPRVEELTRFSREFLKRHEDGTPGR